MGAFMIPVLVLGVVTLPITLPVMVVQQFVRTIEYIFDFERWTT